MSEWSIWGGHPCRWKWDHFIKESKETLEHFFWSHCLIICVKKLQDIRNLIQVANNRKRSGCCCLGFDYAKGWALSWWTIIKDENGRTHLNKAIKDENGKIHSDKADTFLGKSSIGTSWWY
jgi:hypothetical protein